MPEGKKKSRTLRRVFVRTPGGRVTVHYKERKPKKASCANCGKVLAGMARGRPVQIGKLPKSKRRPERPYGGVLCSACMRAEIIKKARGKNV